jgi:hypothetical protein
MPKEQISRQTPYDPAKSSSARKMSGATWKITYGDGSSSSGDVYLDVATVGNISFLAQAVEAAKQVSPEFTNDENNDGVFGLAFSSLNQVTPDQQLTFFDNLIPTLDKSVFTVDLRRGARKPPLVSSCCVIKLTCDTSWFPQLWLHRSQRILGFDFVHAGQ